MKKKTNYSRFLLLWAGSMISQVGGGLTSFGLGVYIFNRTGSAAQMALVTLLGFLPTLLLSVPAGVLADLFDRRLLMMIGDGCSAIGIIYILFCMNSGGAALWQICAGVFVSACFSALPEPAFKATITDLLAKEEYTKASGLTSLAGSARYLVSPVIAGLLLAAYDIRLLLIIDISTFFVTAAAAAAVRRGLWNQRNGDRKSFAGSLREGWKAVHTRKGVFRLILVSSVMSMFIGVIQVLSEPLVLSFADSRTLGIAETVCALGMLATALVTGIAGIRKRHAAVLGISLALAGLFMTVFALQENIVLICISGFLFFAMLPLANSSLDYNDTTNRTVFEGSYAGASSFAAWEDSTGNNRRMLEVRTKAYQNSLDWAVLLRVCDAGTWGNYRVFHSGMVSGVPVANGGTGATTAANARSNLGTNNAANITTGTLPAARLPFKYAYGSTSINGSSATYVDYSSAGFTSTPVVLVTYSTTSGNWSGDNGAIKVHSKTTSGCYIVVGGNFSTSRNVDWFAFGV